MCARRPFCQCPLDGSTKLSDGIGESRNVETDKAQRGPKIHLFGREFEMPQSRALRITIGVLLIVFGIFGFLPVLGFWMIPLGVFVLSYEFAIVRRARRRLAVWWQRRKGNGR